MPDFAFGFGDGLALAFTCGAPACFFRHSAILWPLFPHQWQVPSKVPSPEAPPPPVTKVAAAPRTDLPFRSSWRRRHSWASISRSWRRLAMRRYSRRVVLKSAIAAKKKRSSICSVAERIRWQSICSGTIAPG